MNNSVSALAALSHEAQTLSPYARGHEHIAVRSYPHLGRSNTSAGLSGMTSKKEVKPQLGCKEEVEQGKQRGNRKRVHRVGVQSKGDIDDNSSSRATSPHSDEFRLSSNGGSSTRLSPIGESFGMSGLSMKAAGRTGRTGSLTGMANVLMGPGTRIGGRPNLMRSPDSRTSYGFPEA